MPPNRTSKRLQLKDSSSFDVNGTPTPSPDYPPAEADFSIVSSDGVAFGFTDIQFRQSSVLLDMTDLGAYKSDIYLVDPDFEKSNAVKLLLDFLSGKRVNARTPKTGAYIEDLSACLFLAKKYEFTQAYTTAVVCCSLAAAWGTDREAADIFCLAARLDEEHLAGDAVRRLQMLSSAKSSPFSSSAGMNWAKEYRVDDKSGRFKSVFPPLDFAAWPAELLKGVPMSYVWALARASQPELSHRTSNKPQQCYYEYDVHGRFQHFLAAAKQQLNDA